MYPVTILVLLVSAFKNKIFIAPGVPNREISSHQSLYLNNFLLLLDEIVTGIFFF